MYLTYRRHLVKRDALVFAVAKGKVHVLCSEHISFNPICDLSDCWTEGLTQALGGGTLEQVVNGSTHDDPLAAGVDSEATNLNAVAASDGLDGRRLANDLHELLTSITILVDVANVAGGHLLLQGDADSVLYRSQLRLKPRSDSIETRVTYVNALEPDSNVRDERNAGAKLCADLLLVDVISQAVRNDVVGEVVHVVLGAGLSASSGVAGNTEDSGLTTQVGHKGGNSNLSGSSVASRVGDTGSLGNLGTADQLRQTVGPVAVEPVVGTQIDDHVALLSTLVHGINKRLANAVGQSHDPAVHISVGGHALNIIGTEVLVDDLTLVVTLQLLTNQLARRDVTQIHVRVSVEQADQSLAGVTTGSNQSNLGGAGVGHVLLSQRGVGVRRGVGSDSLHRNHRTSGTSGTQSIAGRGEGTLLLSRSAASTKTLANVSGGLGSAVQSRLEVDVSKHLATVLVELLHQLLDLITALDTVPEENLSLTAEAAIGLVEEPGQVLIVLLDGPDKLGVVLLDGSEDVVGNVGQPAGLGNGEGSQVSQGRSSILLRGQDNGQRLHRLIIVDLEVTLLQALNIAVNSSAGIQALAVTNQDLLELLEILEVRERSLNVNLVATADQRTGSGVGEEFLLQISRVDDGDAGGTRQVAEQVLHLLDLQAGTVTDPPLSHQVIVLLVEVDHRDLLTGVAVEQATLLGKVNNLERLECTRQLTGSHISVDVQNLAIGSLGHRRKNGKAASLNGRLNGLLVHAIDLANQVVLVLVQVISGEDTRVERARPDTHALQFLNQLQVLLQEQLPGQSQCLSIGDSDSIFELRLDAGVFQHAVKLGSSTVDDNRVQADMVQEGKGGGKSLEVFGDDGTANLDDSELLGGNGGEVREILLHLTLGTDVAQQLNNGRAGGGKLGVSSTGVVTTLQQGNRRGLQGLTSRGAAQSGRGNSMLCGERAEGLAGGSSPHGGAKGEHIASQHAAASEA